MEPSQQHDPPITDFGEKEQLALQQELKEKDEQIKLLQKELDRKEFDIVNLSKLNKEMWEDLSKTESELKAEKMKTTGLQKELQMQIERYQRSEVEQKEIKREGLSFTGIAERGSPDGEISKEIAEVEMGGIVEEGEIVETGELEVTVQLPSCAKSFGVRPVTICDPIQSGSVGGTNVKHQVSSKAIPNRKRKLEQSNLNDTTTNDNEGITAVADRKGHNFLPTLPALAFHFQSTQIRMAIYMGGETKILANASGSHSTPFVVGLTENGNLQYGNVVAGNITKEPETSQIHSSLQDHWWVPRHLVQGGEEPWSKNISLPDGDTRQITVEFLIGFILKSLKSHVETMLSGTCDVAVITVPMWYSSTQRIQVKDGGRLAGFTEVILINEASAAVFASPSISKSMLTSRNVMVLSENSGQIDASVYSRTSFGKKRLVMIAHSGHYFEMGEAKYVDVRSCAEKEMLVHKICLDALSKMESPLHNSVGDTSPPVELIVFAESRNWKSVLEQVGKKHVFRINKDNDALVGAAFLSQEPFQIAQIISDKLAYDVLAKCNSERSNMTVIGKDEFMLPVQSECEIVSHSLPLKCKLVRIFQNSWNGPIEILKLSVSSSIPPNQRIAINLSVTNDGIVDMMDVALLPSTCRNNSAMEKAREEDYSWTTPNLTPENFQRNRSLLEYFSSQVVTPQEIRYALHPLTQAKQSLLLKCKDMTGQLNRGDFPCKSNMVKDAFISVIQSSVALTDRPNVTVEEIHDQMETLSQWGVQYMK